MRKILVKTHIPLLIFMLGLTFNTMANPEVKKKPAPNDVPQAEQPDDTSKKKTNKNEKDVSSAILTNLKTLISNAKEKEAEIKQILKDLKQLNEDQAKEKINNLNALEDEIKALAIKTESVATGISIEDYRNNTPDEFVLAEELEKLLQPIVYSLRAITQDSREIEELKQELESLAQKKEIAVAAQNNISYLLSHTEEQLVIDRLGALQKAWQEEIDNITNDYEILTYQLEKKQQSKVPVLTSTGEMLSDFFKNRGINLVLGVLAFLSVFFFMRFLYFLFKKLETKRQNIKKSTFERLTDLIYHVLTFLVSIVATLFVFNSLNDWLLLGISTIFLVALGWVFINTLPTMVEQLMILLNLGSVREGGRVIYNGVPWKVQKLHFYSHLINPELSGGSLHLPVRQLIGFVSRPAASNEEWFPTNEDDWVKIDDNVGQVIYQSPEMVQVRLFGGNQITYTTENYLALNPMNLSHGYRIQMVFGIDYQYQAMCTTSIPKKMTEKFRQDLIPVVGEENLVRVVVDFFLPNASSLDFEYEVFLKGCAAHLYEEVERTMIYSFADVCNENDWVIPFQQITLHQAKDS